MLNRTTLSSLAVASVPLFAMGVPAQAQSLQYQIRTLSSVVGSTSGLYLAPSINNFRHVLYAGPTQSGNQVFVGNPAANIAALGVNAGSVQDTRLPRFGANSANAVWNANTVEIDPVTKAVSPGSGYQEDRVYLYQGSGAASVIGETKFSAPITSAFASPDVNDAAQATWRRINYTTGTWDLFMHDGSGNLSGTRLPLANWALVNTPFINNAGTVAFYGRAAATDPVSLFNFSGGTLTAIATNVPLAGPTLRDFSDDGHALIFDGSSLTGAFYTVSGSGDVSQLLTAGKAGLSRLELGQRNNNGMVAFGNRTATATGGATPNAGQSDLFTFLGGSIQQITSNAFGTAVLAANLNDNGDLVFITQTFLYDDAGKYTGTRRFDLMQATVVPEPGTMALLTCGVLILLPLARRRRGGAHA